MISIKITFNENVISSILIQGHANQNIHGKDIVCAGVSAIVYGSINSIDDLLTKEDILFDLKDGYSFIEVKHDSYELQLLLNMMITQLKTLEESYPKYIKITKIHGGV